jgi:hypothetical protein
MYCANQCSGRGECSYGYCKCEEGWFGIDCSQPRHDLRSVNSGRPARPLPPLQRPGGVRSVPSLPWGHCKPPRSDPGRPLTRRCHRPRSSPAATAKLESALAAKPWLRDFVKQPMAVRPDRRATARKRPYIYVYDLSVRCPGLLGCWGRRALPRAAGAAVRCPRLRGPQRPRSPRGSAPPCRPGLMPPRCRPRPRRRTSSPAGCCSTE